MAGKRLAAIFLTVHMLSCQTNDANSMQKKNPTKTLAASYNTNFKPVLERIIGQHTHGEARSVYQLCQIMEHQLKDQAAVAQLIEQAKKEDEEVAMHIVATVPSVGYFAMDGTEKILLYEDHSTKKSRNGEASRKLMDIIDEACKFTRK
ncbi:MAG: hypothetical protein ACOH5I_01515 [Oligoflexus sp.]